MNYKESLLFMESLAGIGIVPGLSQITELLGRLDNPQNDLKFIHIAGTNGKGSVLAFVSTICKCAGYKVGRYLSPVISDYCEKIQIGGRNIARNDMAELLSRVRLACEDMVVAGFQHPSPFEVETAAAFLYFKEKACDIVVLEAGMGGREDATNVITTTLVSVLVSISMDHMQFLGRSLGEIAANKAGILKPGRPCISALQKEEAAQAIQQAADEKGCALTFVNPVKKVKYGLLEQSFSYQDTKGILHEELKISLSGKHQVENAALAIEVVRELKECGYTFSEKDLKKGLLETKWPGRFEVLATKPYFIVDGAHNEDAAKKLAESVRFYFSNKRIIYIMGMLKDKEYEKVSAIMAEFAEQIITVTPPENPRALPAYDLALALKEHHDSVTVADSLEEAVEIAGLFARKQDVILCFGSLSFLGRIRKLVMQDEK